MSEALLDGPNWSLIPEPDRAALNRYLRFGIDPGPFLMALVCNDLCRAVNLAGGERTTRLGDYVQFTLTQMPANSFGSAEAVARWIAHGGLDGGPPGACETLAAGLAGMKLGSRAGRRLAWLLNLALWAGIVSAASHIDLRSWETIALV